MQWNDPAAILGDGLNIQRAPGHVRRRVGGEFGDLVGQVETAEQRRAEDPIQQKVLGRAPGIFGHPAGNQDAAGDEVRPEYLEAEFGGGKFENGGIQNKRAHRIGADILGRQAPRARAVQGAGHRDHGAGDRRRKLGPGADADILAPREPRQWRDG